MRPELRLSWIFVAACEFSSPSAVTPDGAGTSGDGCTSFSEQLEACTLPSAFALTLSGMLVFDTSTGVLKDSSNIVTPVVSIPVMTRGAEVRALVATSVHLMPNTVLRAEGASGFAIVASDGITLGANSRIDVSGGAGQRENCGSAAAGSGASDAGGGAGGGGGGLGAAGGDGGNGDSDGGQSAGGQAGDRAAAVPDGPIGGCPGGRGGNGDTTANVGGMGGRGGGAVYLVSAVSIGIGPGAGIDAGGAGGAGGVCMIANGDAGGGGGGSGGSIFLEAPRIRVDGILAANGGGGGEGSGNGTPGQRGSAGAFGVSQASGGQTTAGSGARGGAGGSLTSPTGVKPTELLQGGGGGGGGSVGFIRVRSPDAQLGDNVSPSPT